MDKKSIVIAGTLPPPIGGVTVHIKRLILHLNSIGYNNFFIELRPKTDAGGFNIKQYVRSILLCLSKSKNGILHYQLNNWIEASILSLLCLITNTKFIFTVHSLRPEEFTKMKWFCFNITIKWTSMFIAPSNTIKELLLRHKVKKQNVKVINTYLPPSEIELNEPLPHDLIEFVNRSKTVIVANGYNLYRDKSNVDVYGLDICIEACSRVPYLSFVFCIPIIEDMPYYERCLDKIKKNNLGDRFLIYNKDISLVSLFKYADIFVRPSSTDSFGVSVAEAISIGIPSIASDVCERAEGTIIFKSRNINDFVSKIKSSLENNKILYNQNIDIEAKFISQYIDLYDNF